MGYISWVIILMAFALAMDAFAIAVSLSMGKYEKHPRHALLVALFFGGFQGVMPYLGWLLGSVFSDNINSYGSIISFIILAFLGLKMIYSGLKDNTNATSTLPSLSYKTLLLLAIATSIDAFAIGVGFAVNGINSFDVAISCLIIAIITAILCFFGYKLGNKISNISKFKSEIIGGIILILLALKILLQN